MDLGSTNGTVVNEEKVSAVTLQHGDRVQFGNFIYQFLESNRIEGEYHHSVSSKIRQDDLLCIMNRRAFLEMFARAYRQSVFESRPLTVAMLDLDKFKSINDELGHQAGDDVLLEFVARAQRCCPENGTLARFGGEEFAILFEDFTLQQTLAYAEQIRMAVAEKPFLTNAGPVKLTVSMGLVEQDADPSCGDQRGLGLINRADSLLLEAKRKGRNQICF